MATAKKAAAETVIPAAFEPIANMQESVRASAEKGAEQIKAQYEALKQAAEKATGKIEESFSAVQTGAKTFNLKALELTRANANATFDHVQALFAAKSVSDFVTLQGDFLKKQLEVYAAQAKELAELGQKVVGDAVEPVKSAVVVPFKK